jgi:hypothetical protein
MPITREELRALRFPPPIEADVAELIECEHQEHSRAGLCPECGRWNYGEAYSTFSDAQPLPSAEEIRQAFQMAEAAEKEARYADALVALARSRLVIGLLNTMVCTGESHSDTSRRLVTSALRAIEGAVRR